MTLWHKRAAVLSVFLSLAALSQTQQPSSPDKPPKTLLKSATRMVVVDVVAMDGKGASVPDLKSDDFTLLEDGRPQQISVFSFQHPVELPAGQAAVHLPANVFTNIPSIKPTSLNVILLDALNGEFTSRAYAREQLIKFLEEGHSPEPIAVYALENHLKLLHDFTTDDKEAVSAIRSYKPQVLNHLDSLDIMASPFTQKGQVQTGPRAIETTLVALNSLAQALAGYPGRKNLIWLSEAFPMELFPDLFPSPRSLAVMRAAVASDSPGPFDTIHGPAQAGMVQNSQSPNSLWANSDYAAQVRKVANALMHAQVAVYPIDAAGVGKLSRVSNLATMRDIAERTGGKTFAGQNDLQVSIRGSIDDGSTYYTLAYYPDNKNWSGQLRAIDIKTTRPGISLRYRRGYYALDPSLSDKEGDSRKLVEEFSHSLALDVPSATAVLFQAVLTSPADNNNKVVVNFAIDPHTLSFTEDGGVHQASLSCAAVVFTEKGSLLKETMSTMNSPIAAADFQKLMETTFPCRTTVELKPGKYWMRLGVMDRSSRLIGTTTASVTVPVP